MGQSVSDIRNGHLDISKVQETVQEHASQGATLLREISENLGGVSREVMEKAGVKPQYLEDIQQFATDSCCTHPMSCNEAAVEFLGKPPTPVSVLAAGNVKLEPVPKDGVGEIISITLQKTSEESRLGLDLEYVPEREVIPVKAITGHLAQQWNDEHPYTQVLPGDRVISVNGTHASAEMMMKEIKSSEIVRITCVRMQIEEGCIVDDWEFVRAFYERMEREENMPPRLYELVPYQGDQVVGAGFGDAVTGQIRSAGTVIPWGTASMTALPVKSILADVDGHEQAVDPNTKAVVFRDPRQIGGAHVGVVGFRCGHQDEAWDILCGASFLGNSYNLGLSAMMLEAPCQPGTKKPFQNAHAAFHALAFWSEADEFATLSSHAASQKRTELAAHVDFQFAGFGTPWKGMLAVIRAKYQRNTPWADGLLKTGDAFLVEHHSALGLEMFWSDGGNGEGTNYLGMLQMLVRDELSGSTQWTEYISDLLDLRSGQFYTPATEQTWRDAVRGASRALVDEVSRRQALGTLQSTQLPYGGAACKNGDSFAAFDPLDTQSTSGGDAMSDSCAQSASCTQESRPGIDHFRTGPTEGLRSQEPGPSAGSWV